MKIRQGVLCSVILLPLFYYFLWTANSYKKETESVEIIVLVHGALSLGAKAPLTHFYQFKHDLIEGTPYQNLIRSIRNDPFFYAFQPIKKPGFYKLDLQDLQPEHTAEGCAAIFDVMSKNYCKDKKNRLFYTFGWEGTFSKTIRLDAAGELYNALTDTVHELKKEGKKVTVTAIGFCHGAHIILQMAEKSKTGLTDDFCVDRVICLGMPLSSDLDRCISSPLFKNVYHIFSHHDCVQPIDIFVSGKLVTPRTLTLSQESQKKVTQIDVRVFLYNHTSKEQPDFYKKEHLFSSRAFWRNRSPGHVEFWFFSWAPGNYRKNWILSPFPTVMYVPLMLEYITDHMADLNVAVPIIFDIRPEFNTIILRQKQAKTVFYYHNHSVPQECLQIADMIRPKARVWQKDYDNRVAMHRERCAI